MICVRKILTLLLLIPSICFGGMGSDYFDFDLINTVTRQEGRAYWNEDDGTLNIGMPGGDVNLQVGQEMIKRVKNITGSTILNGTPVYISGESGNRLTIAPADAAFSAGVAFRTYAVATEDIEHNALGYVTKDGVARDINLSAYAGGVPLYLAVGGGYSTSPPTSPDVTILIGVVEKATADGELDVNITSIPNLNSLSDVLITSISDNDLTYWDTDVWKNSGLTEIGTPLTLGSILFAGTDGAISEDNANFFWDDTNNRLGIGTATPSEALHLEKTLSSLGVVNRVINKGTGNNTFSEFYVGSDGATGLTGAFTFGSSGVEKYAKISSAIDGAGGNLVFATSSNSLALTAALTIDKNQDVTIDGDVDVNGDVDIVGLLKVEDTTVALKVAAIIDNSFSSGGTQTRLGLYRSGAGEGITVNDGFQLFTTTGLMGFVDYENRRMGWWTGGPTENMVLLANGNVGIATSGPSEKLEVTGNIFQTTDNNKHYWGTGKDASVYYDGADFNLKTDEVAASDLLVTTGAAKTLELQTVVWDDLRVPISSIRLGGAQPPTETAYKGGLVLAFPSTVDKTMYFNAQLPHSYKEGEDIEFHTHIAIPTSGAGGGAENIKFDLTCSWANMGAVFPAETTYSHTEDVQNYVADTHMLVEVADPITGTGKTISSQLICSLTRDVSVVNDYADFVYVAEVDFHYPLNTMGSRQEGSK